MFSPMVVLGQMERDPKTADIEAGLIGAWSGPVMIHEGGQFALPAAAVLNDLALAFSLSVAPDSALRQTVPLLALGSHSGSPLTLSISPDREIVCAFRGGLTLSAALTKPNTEPQHVVINVRRDARQPLAGIWLDGVEVASGKVGPGEWKFIDDHIGIGNGSLRGSVARVRLYDRTLTRPDIAALTLAEKPLPNPPPAFADRLEFRDGEVIALLGGSDAVALGEDWRFGAMLHMAAAAKGVRFRNLAWEADTVFRQDRPMGFGNLHQQLQRAGAACVLLMFGRQECLERGEGGLAAFEEGLNQLLAQCHKQTPRLAIIGAAPFEKKDPPLPDLSSLNPVLQQYNLAMERVAQNHRALFIDVRSHLPNQTADTVDGMQFAPSGLYQIADAMLRSPALRADGYQMAPVVLKGLREPIEQCNRLWHDYWRPSNWAFLHGDRTAQPSSRDHLDPTKRWFPGELEKYHALIEAKEQEIWKRAEELGRKLP